MTCGGAATLLLAGMELKTIAGQLGHSGVLQQPVGITARTGRGQVPGGLISQYRQAAQRA